MSVETLQLTSAIAEEAIKRIAALYAVEKAVRYKPVEECVALRQEKAKPVFDDLEDWLQLGTCQRL